MPDFKKLGLDRIAVNVAKTVGAGGGNLVTGDIARGEVVEVTFSASTTGTATVSSRRTLALLGSVDLDTQAEYQWSIVDTTLTVNLNAAKTGTMSFWVF